MKHILGIILMVASFGAAAEVVVSGNFGATSDYVFRGESQSNEEFAIQGGLDFNMDQFYAGVWASTVDFHDGDEASTEVDFYGGYVLDFNKNTALDVGAIYYSYPGAAGALDYNFYEIYAGLSHSYQNDLKPTAEVKVSYSPDYFASQDDTLYTEVNGSVALPYDITLGAHAGYLHFSKRGINNVSDYKVGVSKTFFEKVDTEFAWTKRNDDNELTSSRFMLTSTVSF